MKKAYPIILTQGKKFVVVFVPDFNINTQGNDIPGAMEMARNAIGLVGIDMQDDGETLPEASSIAAVQENAPAGGFVSLVDVDFAEYRRKNERYIYPAVFTYEEGQEIAVWFPDLDAATSGENDDDALLSARELLGCVIFGLEEDGEDIPKPTPLAQVKTGEQERAVLIDVYMPSIRMAQVNRTVNRTVTLPAWLNAAALEKNINFSAVLQAALKNALNITER